MKYKVKFKTIEKTQYVVLDAPKYKDDMTAIRLTRSFFYKFSISLVFIALDV